MRKARKSSRRNVEVLLIRPALVCRFIVKLSNWCFRYINGTRLDDRIVRTDWDAGFVEGRQYGRGKTGGQVRDEYRTDYDSGRGGYGKIIQQKIGVNEGGFSR